MDEKYPFLQFIAADKKKVTAYLDDRPVVAEKITEDLNVFNKDSSSKTEVLEFTLAQAFIGTPDPLTTQAIERALKAYIQGRGGLGLAVQHFIPQSMTLQSVSLALWGDTGKKVATKAAAWNALSPSYDAARGSYDLITSTSGTYISTPHGRRLYEQVRDGVWGLIQNNPDMNVSADDILEREVTAFHDALFTSLKEKKFFKEKGMLKKKVEFNVGNLETLEMALLDGINKYCAGQQERVDEQKALQLLSPLRTSSPSIPIPSSSHSWRLSEEKRITPPDGVMPTPSGSSYTASSSVTPDYALSVQSRGSNGWVSGSYSSNRSSNERSSGSSF